VADLAVLMVFLAAFASILLCSHGHGGDGSHTSVCAEFAGMKAGFELWVIRRVKVSQARTIHTLFPRE
jgi:hypothetical protein